MSLIDFTNGLPLADALKLLNQAVEDQHTSRFLNVAAVSVMLYDIIITFEQERSLIWPARWSHGKILYFLTRYPVAIEEIFWLIYTVDMTASESFCKFEAYFGVWSTLIFLIPLQIVIVLRTIALWNRKRAIIILLWGSLIGTDIVILVTLSRIMTLFTYSMNQLLRPILGCESGLLTLDPTTSIPAWAGVIAFDTVLFVLTLVRGIRSYKFGHSHLLTVLVRDGFAYYCVMLILGLSNLLLLSALPIPRSGLAAALTPVLRCAYSVIGSRLVLNLRGAASQNLSHDSTVQDVHLVDMSGSSSSGSQQDSRTETFIQIPRAGQLPIADSQDWRLGPSTTTVKGSFWDNKVTSRV